MRKLAGAIISLLLVMSIFFAVGIQSVYASEVNQLLYPGLNPDKFEPNGEYAIYVFEGNLWQEAESLSFDRFLREREIDLGNYLTGDTTVKIKIVQKGGGAANLDSVFLEGVPPVEVNGAGDLALNKLSKKDYDVINVGENGVELTFPANTGNKILSITARIEGERISETPFQFPQENLFKVMDEKAKYYTYRLNSVKNSLPMDGRLDEVSSKEPFFKEYCLPGTGHPPGFTYGWVMNDDSNLYVAMDFTPDNTMDGDKDYAKVYVMTSAGLKEFKESVPETRWGEPAFMYTDKVSYQHKVYEFRIPLQELGIGSGDEEKDLSLAFAAYGTAAPIGITLDEGNYLLAEGATHSTQVMLNYSFGIPSDVTSSATYVSSNTTVASVYANGVVNGLSPGTAKITVNYYDIG